jgi:hypothetical protein
MVGCTHICTHVKVVILRNESRIHDTFQVLNRYNLDLAALFAPEANKRGLVTVDAPADRWPMCGGEAICLDPTFPRDESVGLRSFVPSREQFLKAGR